MTRHVRNFSLPSHSRPITAFSTLRLVLAFAALGAAGFAVPALSAQVANRILQTVDPSQLRTLPNHHPLWAVAANSIGPVPSDLPLNQLTLVLSRSPQQQAAFDQFVASQQNPASPDYHHWLTPAEVGARFGLSDQDIATIAAWLQSQGLHVNWVSPNRIFIGFGGSAANVGRAFQTEMNYYSVRGEKRLSVDSDPLVPAVIQAVITAIRGLYTINEQPNHHVGAVQSAMPQLNGANGTHFLTPSDFDTVYDVPASLTGAGMTIGIISWSRTNFADFDNFKSKTGATFADPTEVVPTAYGGIDPGPAYTAPPTGNVSLGGQSEATLDVTRAGSVAPGANLLLVVSSQSGTDDGIGADAQYLVNTTPVPAQVMSISFGACEASAGSGGVAFWNNLFQTAAAEGISVFVSSGDSGASGCDNSFSAPPTLPTVDSPNYICSSSYATCVGGTEFADTASPSTYWSSTNGVGYLSALSYIPEGAWNESTSSFVAATAGGASTVIATPSWQTGAGVPSPGTGRYTPDVSFSAADHDGYFACMAAGNGSCVTTNGSFSFIAFSGTSAAAPGMAGVAALLGQQLGAPQGNLNPQLYSLATSVPSAFHDVTVASSAVSACSVNTASMCNNTIPAATGGSFRPGYLVGDGYDEATGLGSLDVATFIHNYTAAAPLPTATTGAASAITTTSAALAGTANPNGTDTKVWFLYGASSTLSGASQTSSQDIGSGTTASPVTANISGLTAGTTYYFQLEAQSSAGINFGSIQPFTTSPASKATPTITWNTPAAVVVGTALSATQLNATASVPGTFLYNPPAGTVMSAIGNITLSTTFTPADTSAYNTATSSVTLVVAAVLPGFTLSGTAVSLTAGATSGNTSTITVQPTNGFTGPVTLTAVVTTGPFNAQDVPTLGFGATSPVSIASTGAGTATMTISTIATQNSCAVENEMPRGTPWYTRGGAVLACLLLFGIVPRRLRGRALLGMLLLFVALAGGLLACGGGGSTSTCNAVIPGTAAGSYTITITGTSGSATANNTIALTVQ
jgi:subtilase family serine protease